MIRLDPEIRQFIKECPILELRNPTQASSFLNLKLFRVNDTLGNWVLVKGPGFYYPFAKLSATDKENGLLVFDTEQKRIVHFPRQIHHFRDSYRFIIADQEQVFHSDNFMISNLVNLLSWPEITVDDREPGNKLFHQYVDAHWQSGNISFRDLPLLR